jgi:hypothetical protein
MKDLIKKLLRETLLKEISEEAYKLLKTKFNDSRVIMSKEEEITFKNSPNQENRRKPIGLWYGIGSSWVDWIRYNQPSWEKDFIHIVDVDLSKMKVIRNNKQLIEFHNEYFIKDEFGGNKIDWGKVAEKYSGIEISPFIVRYYSEIDWYYGWDVSSGCIWNSDAIKDIKKLNDKYQDYKVVYRGQPEGHESSSPSQSIWVTYDYNFASQYGEIKKYKLPKKLNILDVDYYGEWESLVDEFDENGDYDDYKYEPSNEFISFLSSKGYDGFENGDNILIFNKKNVGE